MQPFSVSFINQSSNLPRLERINAEGYRDFCNALKWYEASLRDSRSINHYIEHDNTTRPG